MSPSRKFSEPQISDSMHPLKARLQVLGRPQVWGAVSVLLVASYGLFQYWTSSSQTVHSDQGSSPVVNPARRNPLIGSESDFGGSDFGSLPGIPQGLPQPYAVPGLTSTSPKANGSPTKPNTFNPFTTHPVTADTPSGSDPLISPGAATGTSAGIVNPGSSVAGSSVAGSSVENSATARFVSPLQSGLDRNLSPQQGSSESANGTPSGTSSGILTGGNPVGNSAGGSLNGGNPAGTLSPGGVSQFQPYVPRTSPPTGSTGYTVPPAFRTPANSRSDDTSGFSGFSRPQPIPGFTSTPTGQLTGVSPAYGQNGGAYSSGGQSQSPQSQSPQSQSPSYQSPQLSPFSVPRTTPGRSIGGGQINTFSNP